MPAIILSNEVPVAKLVCIKGMSFRKVSFANVSRSRPSKYATPSPNISRVI